jgi:anti-sigma B factor antagonist
MRTADVTLPSRVDVTTSGDVRYALQIAIDASPDDDVVVDCRRLDVVDVAGLGVLVGAHRRARVAGRRLVLADPSPRVLRLLAVTRLHRILHVSRSGPATSAGSAPVAATSSTPTATAAAAAS